MKPSVKALCDEGDFSSVNETSKKNYSTGQDFRSIDILAQTLVVPYPDTKA